MGQRELRGGVEPTHSNDRAHGDANQGSVREDRLDVTGRRAAAERGHPRRRRNLQHGGRITIGLSISGRGYQRNQASSHQDPVATNAHRSVPLAIRKSRLMRENPMLSSTMEPAGVRSKTSLTFTTRSRSSAGATRRHSANGMTYVCSTISERLPKRSLSRPLRR